MRLTLNAGSDGVTHLRIDDPVSGVMVVDARIEPDVLVAALGGLRPGHEGIPCTWGRLDRVGWMRLGVELSVSDTSTPSGRGSRLASITKRLAATVGGEWEARSGDLGNPHRRRGGGPYRVIFFGLLPPGSDIDKARAKAETFEV